MVSMEIHCRRGGAPRRLTPPYRKGSSGVKYFSAFRFRYLDGTLWGWFKGFIRMSSLDDLRSCDGM